MFPGTPDPEEDHKILSQEITRLQIEDWIAPHVAERARIEFKQDIQREKIPHILSTIVGLVNQGGGIILFGVTEEAFARRPDHPERAHIRRPDVARRFFEQLFSDIRQHIRPPVDNNVVKQDPIKMDLDWQIIVLKVLPLLEDDLYLRTYQHIAYARTNQPATIKMEPLHIWEFHRNKLHSKIREQLFSINKKFISFILSEMAFQIFDRSSDSIDEKDTEIIIQKHYGKPSDDLSNALKSHDALLWQEHSKQYVFTSHIPLMLYSALYLNKLQNDELSAYIISNTWTDIVTMLAHLSERTQFEFIVEKLFEQQHFQHALQCLVNRSPDVTITARSRNQITRYLEMALQQSDDTYEHSVLLDTIANTLLRDKDDLLRVRVLGVLSKTVLPGSFLLQLTAHLDSDNEADDEVRYAFARIFAEADLANPVPVQIVDSLVQALMRPELDFRIFETIFVATVKIAIPDMLFEIHADALAKAASQIESWYTDQGLEYNRNIEAAINTVSALHTRDTPLPPAQ